ERVEAVNRIGRDDGKTIDREVGDEVPAYIVAKRLVEPHAVLIDRKAGGRSQHWRYGKAAVLDVRLKQVVFVVVDADAAQTLVQERGQRRRSLLGDVGGRQNLNICRHLVAVDAEARGERRWGDDVDRRKHQWLAGYRAFRRGWRCLRGGHSG